MPSIVTVNVSLTLAPEPEQLQRTGAFISQGGTITSAGTSSLLTQLSDLTPLLTSPGAVSSIAWSGGTVTVTTNGPHGYPSADSLLVTLAGFVPTGYNGTFLCTVTGTTTFTFPLATNPGSVTTEGTYVVNSAAEIEQMATTFFAQGSGVGVYVLELGPGGPNTGVTALSSYIATNPNTSYVDGAQGYFYGYLVPREWDANTSFLNLIAEYESPSAKTYFWVTTTLATYTNYLSTMKNVVALVEAPAYGAWKQNTLTSLTWSNSYVTAVTTSAHGVSVGQWFQIQGCTPSGYNGWHKATLGTTGSTLVWYTANNPGAESVLGSLEASLYTSTGVASTEFSLAADFQHTLNYNPGPTNKVTPNAFAFIFGVTAFPTQGNNSILTTLKNANINYIGTGAEGGISETILVWGVTADGNDFQVWYSIDWVQINADIAIAAAIIDGSNNPINPLYYNQQGINVLQSVVAGVLATGVSYGLVLGSPVQTELNDTDLDAALDAGTYAGQSVVNAIPFLDYVQLNPDDYPIGKYSGLSAVYTPLRGFIQIVFNLNVSFFPGQV